MLAALVSGRRVKGIGLHIAIIGQMAHLKNLLLRLQQFGATLAVALYRV